MQSGKKTMNNGAHKGHGGACRSFCEFIFYLPDFKTKTALTRNVKFCRRYGQAELYSALIM